MVLFDKVVSESINEKVILTNENHLKTSNLDNKENLKSLPTINDSVKKVKTNSNPITTVKSPEKLFNPKTIIENSLIQDFPLFQLKSLFPNISNFLDKPISEFLESCIQDKLKQFDKRFKI